MVGRGVPAEPEQKVSTKGATISKAQDWPCIGSSSCTGSPGTVRPT